MKNNNLTVTKRPKNNTIGFKEVKDIIKDVNIYNH